MQKHRERDIGNSFRTVNGLSYSVPEDTLLVEVSLLFFFFHFRIEKKQKKKERGENLTTLQIKVFTNDFILLFGFD